MKLNNWSEQGFLFFSVLMLVLGIPYGVPAFAQTVLPDSITVSTTAVVELVFAAPSQGEVENGEGFYSIKGGSRTSLLISARKDAAPVRTLVVREGGRTHRFTLVFKQDAAAARHDYSNLQSPATKPQNQILTGSKDATLVIGDRRPNSKEKALLDQWLLEGNNFYNLKQWDSAKLRFTWMLPYKGKQLQVAQQKLKEIAAIQQNQVLEKEQRYLKAMDSARNLVQVKRFKDAEVAVLRALYYKPGDTEGQQLLAELKPLVAKQRQEETNIEVQEYLRKADLAIKAKRFLEAEEQLLAALRIDPSQIIAAKKLKELGDKPRAERYQLSRQRGDSLYKAGSWDAARREYELAAQAKIKDSYVQTQLKKVNQQQRLALQQVQYQQAISNGDIALKNGNLDGATSEYQRANRIFPDSVHPKKQLTFIIQQRKGQQVKQTVKANR
ncbi:tetratricopeptide repeat protein [Cnuella takakiae]|nr:hypothetical protein [Cnuella takakiae]